ncbi:hypothetical protein GS597_19615 [Synechococcales cyanobacterium C]|uniref:Uncharacterized protein n=1 Tax=Petrachloros mirabilis ULC683 TaxID=2781853 RepID=A0A8K2A1B8_9CYAN|nr:hypothetical protein [Petrachloros mirabilis]NCJ08673.1 hypothetical protein [Petrachloros mirabilis ULC683]
MSFSDEQQIELRIQKGIREAEDQLVIWIQDALDKCDYPSSGRDKLEESQFRNLVRVSDTTESPEVVKNFLRYQVGRDQKWGRGSKSLAERIVGDIDGNLKKIAQDIAKQVNRQDFQEIHINLVRRYLGYGARHLKYRNDGRA